MPYDGEIIANYAHYHSAGLGMASAFGDTSVCQNKPTYSKWRGGEQLTGISECRVGLPDKKNGKVFQPVSFKKGDRYDVGMIYQQDSKPHYGVMGFSVLFVHRANKTKVNSRRTVNFQDLWREMQDQVGLKDMECKLCALLKPSQSLESASMHAEAACRSLPDSRVHAACLGVVSLAAQAIVGQARSFKDLDSTCSMLCGGKHAPKSMSVLV